MKKLLFIILLGLLAACSDGLVDFESDEVEGRVSEGKVAIYNKLDAPVYYFLIEREIAARIDLVFESCCDEMNSIEAGHVKRVALNDAYEYKHDDEILLYYWTEESFRSGNTKRIAIKID